MALDKAIVAFVRNVAVIELGGWAIGVAALVVGVGTGVAGRALFEVEARLAIGIGCPLGAAYVVGKRLPNLSTDS